MLHKETIDPGTLELLKHLQAEPELETFNLVGGTSLALQIGHRKSIDLDLFTDTAFDLEALTAILVTKEIQEQPTITAHTYDTHNRR